MNDKLLNDINALTQMVEKYSASHWNNEFWVKERMKDIMFILRQIRQEQVCRHGPYLVVPNKDYEKQMKEREGGNVS